MIIPAAQITGVRVVRPRGVKEMDEKTPVEIIEEIERLLDIEFKKTHALLIDNFRLTEENESLRSELKVARRQVEALKDILEAGGCPWEVAEKALYAGEGSKS